MFPNLRNCATTNRVYLSVKIELTHTVSQIKNGSKYNATKGIFDTLSENKDFFKINKLHSQIEARTGLFSSINPKVALRYIQKNELRIFADGWISTM